MKKRAKKLLASLLAVEMVISSATPIMADEHTVNTELSSNAVTDPGEMTATQRNSLNMLNYLTVLTQEINDSKKSRLYVESAYSSLLNNTYPNAVDSRTQAQLTNILDTLEAYRMVDVKRERIQFIYEQNKAQAMRQAIPSPMSVLNVVQSGSVLKAAISVVYMAVDSYSSYSSYAAQADMDFLKEGLELDDEENAELHQSRKQAFTYMLNMVRENNLQGDYALSEDTVKEFVTWKNNTNVVRRISFLESNKEAYQAFGNYWLLLARSYYEAGEYKKCLDSVNEYEKISSRIFRKDYEYAKILPLAIVAAKEVYSKERYKAVADKYTQIIIDNSDNNDWTSRYFVAQIYLDLFTQTKDKSYEQKAYKIAYDNVNYLVDEQKELNAKYLADFNEAEASKNATKREKEEIKQYNKTLKAERKVALPPVSEALYLNCDLLFALANELNISSSEKRKIDSILHEKDESIFLMQEIDKRYWFEKKETIKADDISVSFTGGKIEIPASYMSSNSKIEVAVDDKGKKIVFNDWTIDEVNRKKNNNYLDYIATFKSKTSDKFKYTDGMKITVTITPVPEDPDEILTFRYKANEVKKGFVFDGVEFERLKK